MCSRIFEGKDPRHETDRVTTARTQNEVRYVKIHVMPITACVKLSHVVIRGFPEPRKSKSSTHSDMLGYAGLSGKSVAYLAQKQHQVHRKGICWIGGSARPTAKVLDG